MKSQSDLHIAVLVDQGRLMGIDTSLDVATLTSAVKEQGEKVLTLWLPAVGSALEHSLAAEQLSFPIGTPFSKRRSKTDMRPSFLFGFWAMVFDRDGVLFTDSSVSDGIRALRQIFHLHGKLKELPTDDKVENAFAQYVRTDNEVSQMISPEFLAEFRQEAREAWGPEFSYMERLIFSSGFLPDAKHGPGAVSQKLTSNGKWESKEWSERLERYFRATEFLNHDIAYEGDDLILHPPGAEPPARVVAVPKTAKTPRIITIEPVYNQFIQQGLAAMFARWMYSHPQVSYEFREPNMVLARAGSVDGSFATIDLSEASDRISLRLVKELFGDHKYLLGAILACRSMTSELQDGTRVLLRKFASMGSALTFPIQTLVFATIARMAVRRVNSRSESKISSQIRVYGDDIIVPTEAALETMDLLRAFGLKVNDNKSFWTGRFRESCGGDYFSGSDVSIVRTRKRLPSSRRDVDEVVAIVAFRNLYWKRYGDSEFVTGLDAYIERLITFPVGYETTPALVRLSHQSPTLAGWDSGLQKGFIYASRAVYRTPDDKLDGAGALLKFFWTPFNEDSKHLQRAGRPVSARIKYGKVYL